MEGESSYPNLDLCIIDSWHGTTEVNGTLGQIVKFDFTTFDMPISYDKYINKISQNSGCKIYQIVPGQAPRELLFKKTNLNYPYPITQIGFGYKNDRELLNTAAAKKELKCTGGKTFYKANYNSDTDTQEAYRSYWNNLATIDKQFHSFDSWFANFNAVPTTLSEVFCPVIGNEGYNEKTKYFYPNSGINSYSDTEREKVKAYWYPLIPYSFQGIKDYIATSQITGISLHYNPSKLGKAFEHLFSLNLVLDIDKEAEYIIGEDVFGKPITRSVTVNEPW